MFQGRLCLKVDYVSRQYGIWGVFALSIDYGYAEINHFEREILEKSLNLEFLDYALNERHKKCFI